MRSFWPIAVLAAGLTVAGCEDEDEPAGTEFSFLVITDTHVRIPGAADDTGLSQQNLDNFDQMVKRINREFSDAAFVAVTGDLVGCLFSDNADDYLIGQDNPAERFKAFAAALAMPCHPALGNHDYEKGFDSQLQEGVSSGEPARMEAVWRKVLGIEPYYSFLHAGVRFIVLNTNRGAARSVPCPLEHVETGCAGSFDDAQLEWLQNELLQPEPCVLFMHHPPITDHNGQAGWSPVGEGFQIVEQDRFYDVVLAFREKIKLIFVGHGHLWAHDTLYESIGVYETGSIGDYLGNKDNVRVVRVNAARDRYEVESGNPSASE